MSASAAPMNGSGPRAAIELDCAAAPPTTVLVRGARLLDPRAGLDKLGTCSCAMGGSPSWARA